MPDVRPELLRRVYEAAWDGGLPPEQLYEGATFEEYYALERLHYPDMSRHTAAQRAPFAGFRALAAELPPDPPRPALQRPYTHLDRKATLDLASGVVPADAERLVLDRIKSITGWGALAELPRLRILEVQLSGTGLEGEPGARAEIDALEVQDCTKPCFHAALRATSARAVSFSLPDLPVDLGLLDGHTRLRELRAGAALVRGVERLSRWPLTLLELGTVPADDGLRHALAALAPSLSQLTLGSDDAFGPSALPDLAGFPHLRRVSLTVHGAEHRDAWIAYAVARPAIDFIFMSVQPAKKAPRLSLQEIYRGIDILRVGAGKKVAFEVSGDLAPDFDAEDNGELEDRLKAAAKRAKKKIQGSSEADTFVVRAADLETARWLIDALHGEGSEAPAPKTKTKKASR